MYLYRSTDNLDYEVQTMFNKLGVQLYTVRDFMKTPEDTRKTFKRLKDLGYDQGQTAGSAIPYEEYARIAKEEGIELVGTHENFDRMLSDFDEALRIQKLLSCNVMGIGGAGQMVTVEEAEAKIAQMNQVCANLKPHGMKFSFHHHSHEFFRLENGKTAFEMICEGLDPEVGTICLDTYWVQNGGGDVRYWISKLKDRIEILHLKDMKKSDRDDWLRTDYSEIGCGNLYWEGILEEAEKANVKYYVVEQDTSDRDIFESLEMSSEYLHKNFMK